MATMRQRPRMPKQMPETTSEHPEYVALILGELRALRKEVDRLTVAVRRPERTKYSPGQAARRLGIGRTKVYDLMKREDLAYVVEEGRRFITEAACQDYERRARTRG